jgi:GT2 family glycosyltransferase
MAAITLIIPVYNALADLKRCLSALAQHTPTGYRLWLANDASPDPAVKPFLDSLQEPHITVVHRERNGGFTGNVNDAMRETDLFNEDVIWLNSDAVPTAGWLEGILALASRVPQAATITPFSNNAEIFSYPEFVANNPAPSDAVAVQLAAACSEMAAWDYPLIEAPTGVGFCMFVRRLAWRSVGELDAASFGRGYGEENDWCQRAAKAGWHNLFCPASYVMHTGQQSFTADKAALVLKNSQTLNNKHPGYDLAVQQFIAADPIKPWRQRLQSLTAARSASQGTVAHISHGKGGGVERHVHDIVAQCQGLTMLVITAMEDVWQLSQGEAKYTLTRLPDEPWAAFLGGICTAFNVQHIHLHHWVTCHTGLLLALQSAPCAYGVTLHDFYSVCPLVHLINSKGEYCHAPTDVATCQSCVSRQVGMEKLAVSDWRLSHALLLGQAAYVIAPSQFTKAVIAQYLPAVSIEVLPHSVAVAVDNSPKQGVKKQRIGVVGAIGPVKGARLLEQLAKLAAVEKAPLEFVLIGYLDTHFHAGSLFDGHLQIHGHYEPNQLGHWLNHYGIDLVCYPSMGPESFSYTLSEVWAQGRAVAATAVGTVADRVAASGGGWVFADSAPSKILADLLRWSAAEMANERGIRAAKGQAQVALESDQMAPRLQALYTQSARPSKLAGLNPERLFRALLPAALTAETHPKTRRLVGKLARYLLPFRHSRLGQWVQAKVPPHRRAQLRQLLLRA